jgi:hypothetical protein
MKKAFLIIFLLAALISAYPVQAAIDKYAPGDTIIIGEFVYDDDYVATTTPCIVEIYNPAGDSVLSDHLMTALSNGWHFYSTSTITTEGVWPVTMTCGSVLGGDLANLDKSFVVGYTSASTTAIANSVWNNSATSSIAAVINANTDVEAANINTNTNATVLAASSSLAAIIASLPETIWQYGSRTLTSFGTLVADIWGSPQSPWTISTSDFGAIVAGSDYLAHVTTVYNGTLTDSANVPTVTIYDPSRNVIVNGVPMTRTSTGTYTYSYTTAGNASAGTWESVFSTTVEAGKILSENDYWSVSTTPAQVIINSISDNTIPVIGANVTITNEGLSGNEYQYEWCVVSNADNTCGGSDDVFHAVAAKYINAGEDFNTTLTADVATAGNYYFKTIVYFGTESSGASRSFTTVAASVVTPSNTGGGGGSGKTPVAEKKRTDFNLDGKVNSIDFSIILYFWKSKPPFRNQYVDVNKDGKIDSIDFSILLYEWDKK